MKKLIVAFVLILAFAYSANAQSSEYKTAAGLRLGYPWALSIKHFISEKGAVEGFVGMRIWPYTRAINVGALYQHHSPISEVAGLKWYVGGGASAWLWTYDNDFNFGADYGSFNVGIMGNLGLDYKFADFPLNVSVDWVPTFVVGDAYYGGFGGLYGGLSGRYTFR